MLIRSKAPLRVSFTGGGTDVSPYCDEKGGLVLNATIGKFAYATLKPRKDNKIIIHSLDYHSMLKSRTSKKFRLDGNLDLAKSIVNRIKNIPAGFEMWTHCDVPPGSGLGSSSTMIVAIIGAFKEWQNLPLSDYDIANLACKIERNDLKIKGGKQDQYAASFGGFNFMEFYKDMTVVNPLKIRQDVINELEYNMILCYVGQTRMSSNIIDEQTKNYRRGKKETLDAMDRLKKHAVDMKRALLTGNLHEFGSLLHEAWEFKKKMAQEISSPAINHIYSEIRKAGAIGGKLSGAGGGGFMMVYCDYHKKHKVIEKMRNAGVRVESFQFEKSGLQTWKIHD